MGYCADGSGFANLKRDADIAELKAKLDALDVWLNWRIYKDSVDFYDSDNYHEDETIEFLNTLAPYVAEGEVNYTGEDGCIWRFRFDPDEQEWVEESATIDYNFESYTDEQMIEELDKRGYIVQKKPQSN
jgi:hypothetical protein|nr:MAG TPA: hypothetical protein [Caudoviricetes sp.]